MVTAEPAQLMTIEYPSAVKEEAKAAAAPKQEESDEVKEQKRLAQESDAVGVTSTEVFAKYQPSHAQPGCAHPADVAEAASLAATPAPLTARGASTAEPCRHHVSCRRMTPRCRKCTCT